MARRDENRRRLKESWSLCLHQVVCPWALDRSLSCQGSPWLDVKLEIIPTYAIDMYCDHRPVSGATQRAYIASPDHVNIAKAANVK